MSTLDDLTGLVESFNKRYTKKYFESLERKRQSFVTDFSVEKIKEMTLEEYAIGQGKKANFCYRFEIDLKDLGIMLGSPTRKYGIFFSKAEDDMRSTERYEGGNFELLRQDILTLLEDGKNENYEGIEQSALHPLFRSKLLAVYYPKDYQYIFSEEHLDDYLEWFGQDPTAFDSILSKQLYMGRIKEDHPVFSKFSPLAYRMFLEMALFDDSKYKQENVNTLPGYLEAEDALDQRSLNIVMEKFLTDGRERVLSFTPQPSIIIEETEIAGKTHFVRDPEIAEIALEMSAFNCEIDRKHKSFVAVKTNKNYVETHHLIPMYHQESFEYSLDVPGNLVILCPTCHKTLHYGKSKDKKELIDKLYNRRKNYLKNSGIPQTIEEMYELYDIVDV